MTPLTIRSDDCGRFWLLDPAGVPTHKYPLNTLDDARMMQRLHLQRKTDLFLGLWKTERDLAASVTGGRDFEVRPCSDRNRKGYAVFDLRDGSREYFIFKRKRDAEATRVAKQADQDDLDNRYAFHLTVKAFARAERDMARAAKHRPASDAGQLSLF